MTSAGCFRIGAPSMVFGPDAEENVYRLADRVDHVEIVLFHTPTLHNIPGPAQRERIRRVAAERGLSLSVHLPTCLEIASADPDRRAWSLDLAVDLITRLRHPAIEHFILHIPYDRPTLAPVPGRYFRPGDRPDFAAWLRRARAGLKRLRAAVGSDVPLFVENINYSPALMAPLWREGDCGFCLDIGHLLLGGESVLPHLEAHLPHIREIHLHGVVGYAEHLGLDVLPLARVRRWLRYLVDADFRGVVNLEVFNPLDLENSRKVVRRALDGDRQRGCRFSSSVAIHIISDT